MNFARLDAGYLTFSHALMRAYVTCGNRIVGRPNVATYDLVAAAR